MKVYSRIIGVILVLIMFLNLSDKVIASEDVVISDGTSTLQVIGDRDLFTEMKELMPGDKVTSYVQIKNISGSQIANFYLYAESSDLSKIAIPETKTYKEDLLKKVKLTVTQDSDNTIIYQGPASGNPADAAEGQQVIGSLVKISPDQQYALKIATLAPNTYTTLNITIEVPGLELDNSYQDTFSAVDWIFLCDNVSESVSPEPTESIQPSESVGPSESIQPSESVGPLESIRPSESVEPSFDKPNTPEPSPIIIDNNIPKTGSTDSNFLHIATILSVLVIGFIIIDLFDRKRQKQTK